VRTAFGEVEIELYPTASDAVTRAISMTELGRLMYAFRYRDPPIRRALLGVYAHLQGFREPRTPAEATDRDPGDALPEAVGRRLEDAARTGELVVRRRPARPLLLPVDVEEEPVLGPDPDLTSWIEIVLVDEDGAPVPGVPYRIECADSRVRSGCLNGAGKSREEGIVPGTCKVRFPTIHGPDLAKV
jgi:hypothetical protein